MTRWETTLWAARDKEPVCLSGEVTLWGYPGKPRCGGRGRWYCSYSKCPIIPLHYFEGYIPVLANLRPEDKPVKIRLTLEVLD